MRVAPRTSHRVRHYGRVSGVGALVGSHHGEEEVVVHEAEDEQGSGIVRVMEDGGWVMDDQ